MYDLAVIGAGWAGFNAALRARERGLRVCIIDSGPIGGTCLNRGCIPTKSLIQSAKVFELAKNAGTFGVTVKEPACDLARMQERKDAIVRQLQAGMKFLLKDIPLIQGTAEFVSPVELRVNDQTLQVKYVCIATGSRPVELEGWCFDGTRILSSDTILGLKAIPVSLLIIGGGVIGCEFASLFASLGSIVTIIEKMPQLLPGEDSDIARKIEGIFRKKGIIVKTQSDAAAVNKADFEKVLICVGRAPAVDGLKPQAVHIRMDKGRVVVDDYLRTSIPTVFAAGDCTGRIMLAHFAAYQGRLAADNIAIPAHPVKANFSCVPNCIFTAPEIASVGLTAQRAQATGRDIVVHKIDFLSCGMARIIDEPEGFMKIVAERATGMIIGASIIGPRATELIAILTVAVSSRMTISALKSVIMAHPTLSEAIHDAVASHAV